MTLVALEAGWRHKAWLRRQHARGLGGWALCTPKAPPETCPRLSLDGRERLDRRCELASPVRVGVWGLSLDALCGSAQAGSVNCVWAVNQTGGGSRSTETSTQCTVPDTQNTCLRCSRTRGMCMCASGAHFHHLLFVCRRTATCQAGMRWHEVGAS